MKEQENLDEFKKEIFRLIADNKVPEAIGKLVELYRSPDGIYYDDLLLLSRQFKDLTDRQMTGLVDDNRANLEKNKITHGLINIISNIETDPVAAKYFGIEVQAPDPSIDASAKPTNKSNSNPLIWIAPILILLVVGGIFFLRPTGGNDTPTNNQPVTEQVKPTSDKTESTQPNPPKENTQIQKTEDEKLPADDLPKPVTFKKSAHSKPEMAKTLSFNQVLKEELLSKEDIHYYTFTATEERNLNIIFTNQTTTFTPVMSMYNDRGNRLFGKSGKEGQGISSVFTARKGKTYQFVINSRAKASFGKYALLITYPE